MVKEESVSGRLPVPLGNQRPKLGIRPKPIPHQVRVFDHATIQLALKLRQFADHSPQQRHVVNSRWTNQEHQEEEYISSGSECLGWPRGRPGVFTRIIADTSVVSPCFYRGALSAQRMRGEPLHLSCEG